MSNQAKEFPYLIFFVVFVGVLTITGVVLTYVDVNNSAKENDFIDNAECNSLKIYIDAGREGKDHFAYWTMESQETVNFSITDKRVDRAQLKYQWECNVNSLNGSDEGR